MLTPKTLTSFAIKAIVPLLLLATWELSIQVGWLPSSLIASPYKVLVSAVRLLSDGSLLRHSFISLQRLFVGFTIGSILGILTGIVVGFSRLGERLFGPTLAVIAPIPVTAWIPLIIIVAGIGELSKSLVISIGVFFPVFFGTYNGIRSADPKLLEVANIYGKSSMQILRQVLLPSAMSSILQAMKSALGLAWVLLIVAEVIASSAGLGWLMWDARNFARPDDMIVGMITAGLLGAATGGLLSWVHQRVLYWRPSFEGQ